MEKDSTSLTSSFTLPLWTPPPEGKPTFPTSMATHRLGGGGSRNRESCIDMDQLIGEDDRTSSSFSAAPTPHQCQSPSPP